MPSNYFSHFGVKPPHIDLAYDMKAHYNLCLFTRCIPFFYIYTLYSHFFIFGQYSQMLHCANKTSKIYSMFHQE